MREVGIEIGVMEGVVFGEGLDVLFEKLLGEGVGIIGVGLGEE